MLGPATGPACGATKSRQLRIKTAALQRTKGRSFCGAVSKQKSETRAVRHRAYCHGYPQNASRHRATTCFLESYTSTCKRSIGRNFFCFLFISRTGNFSGRLGGCLASLLALRCLNRTALQPETCDNFQHKHSRGRHENGISLSARGL